MGTTDYAVWAEHQTYSEEPRASQVIARFQFLLDAIDYAQGISREGSRCVLTGPYQLASVYEPDQQEVKNDHAL